MAKLSLFEVLDSQLSQLPAADGQVIVATDTGSIYRDVLINGSVTRLLIGNDIIVVDELPLAPISNKLYYLKPDKLYFYNSGWVALNGQAVQTDWLQTDDTQVDFLKNKPFGDDLLITEYFSQAETPNPVNFGGSDIGYVCYKISDTILTSEQVAKGVSIATNGVAEDLLSGEMQSFDGFVMVKLPSGQMYASMPRAGELILNSETGFSVNIPESGIYIMFDYGTSLPEGLNVEFSYIGTKKIDPKYLPDNYGNNSGSGVKIVEAVYNFNTGEQTINTDELEAAIDSGEFFVFRIVVTYNGERTGYADFMHVGAGFFYNIVGNAVCVGTYDSYNKTFTADANYDLDRLNPDESVIEGSENTVSGDAVFQALLQKQDKLVLGSTLDNTPTENSNNPITSSGVKEALNSANVDMVDGYHIRVVSDVNDTGLDGYITFIIEE